MNRAESLERIRDRSEPWDMVVIGGGATGVGVAVDAASRGYDVVLLEQSDFGKGTSSRSTKLIHGGVRYLQQGNIPLVMEALEERGILRNNAPHLVSDLPFVVPNYKWWEAPFYGIGMKVYDALAGKYGFGKSKNLSLEETVERLPTIETEGLLGGVVYHDGQFDDARLLVHLAMTAADQGAALVNYARVEGLLKDGEGFVSGVRVVDRDGAAPARAGEDEGGSGEERGEGREGREGGGGGGGGGDVFEVEGRVVVNATGVFSDSVRRMDAPDADEIIRPSQGVHIVLDRSFLPGDSAIMVPRTDDGRVLFAIPWNDRVLVGTTDTPVESPSLEPVPMDDEVDFLLEHARRYLEKDPHRDDVMSVFAGLRPLVAAEDAKDTSEISREHAVRVSDSGLLTIAGGKWTTYRKMAEDTVEVAAGLGELETRDCVTRHLNIHGFHEHSAKFEELAFYGSDASAIRKLQEEGEGFEERIHPRLPLTRAEVVWFAREEMARTVDDVLARRSRSLLLDARAAREAAGDVADILAVELGRGEAWKDEQVEAFEAVADGYILD